MRIFYRFCAAQLVEAVFSTQQALGQIPAAALSFWISIFSSSLTSPHGNQAWEKMGQAHLSSLHMLISLNVWAKDHLIKLPSPSSLIKESPPMGQAHLCSTASCTSWPQLINYLSPKLANVIINRREESCRKDHLTTFNSFFFLPSFFISLVLPFFSSCFFFIL